MKYSTDLKSIVSISHEDLSKAMANFFEIIAKTCRVKAEPNIAYHFTRYWTKRVNEGFNRIDRENFRTLQELDPRAVQTLPEDRRFQL